MVLLIKLQYHHACITHWWGKCDVVGKGDKNNNSGDKMLGLIKHMHYSFSAYVKFGIKNMETKENQLLNGRATSMDYFK